MFLILIIIPVLTVPCCRCEYVGGEGGGFGRGMGTNTEYTEIHFIITKLHYFVKVSIILALSVLSFSVKW